MRNFTGLTFATARMILVFNFAIVVIFSAIMLSASLKLGIGVILILCSGILIGVLSTAAYQEMIGFANARSRR